MANTLTLSNESSKAYIDYAASVINSNEQTMTSLQVAEVTGRIHKNVMRDIRNLLEQLEDKAEFNFELGHIKTQTDKTDLVIFSPRKIVYSSRADMMRISAPKSSIDGNCSKQNVRWQLPTTLSSNSCRHKSISPKQSLATSG